MNSIRRTLLAALALTCVPLAWAEEVVGSGKAVTENRAVSGFRAVALSVPATVELVQGASETLTLTADDNIAQLIESVVEDGQLRIRFRERGRLNVRTRTPIRIAITARVVDSISVAGSADVRASNLSTASLHVSIAGSGDVRYYGDPQIRRSVVGSGSVRRVGASPS